MRWCMSGGWCPTSQWHYYAATHSCFYLSTTEAVWSDAYLACRNMGGNLASIDNHAEMSFVYSILSVLLDKLCYSRPELFVASLCVTRSNLTHQLTDPTQPNPLQVQKFGLNPTRPNTTNNGAYSLVVTYFYTQNLSCILGSQAWNYSCSLLIIISLSHARTVVRECCKGDDESQWERGKFDPRHPKTP